MPKKMLPFVFVLAFILVLVGIYIYKTPAAQLSISPVSTPAPQVTSTPISPNCTKDQLYGSMAAQGAAGSIFADVKITNISKTKCNIPLGNSITAEVSANNISTKYKDVNAGNEEFNLASNGSVYSRIHFPNGPQCNGPTISQNVNFIYDPKGVNLQLKTNDGKNYLTVQACQSNENTQIDIWPVSIENLQ